MAKSLVLSSEVVQFGHALPSSNRASCETHKTVIPLQRARAMRSRIDMLIRIHMQSPVVVRGPWMARNDLPDVE